MKQHFSSTVQSVKEKKGIFIAFFQGSFTYRKHVILGKNNNLLHFYNNEKDK